MNLNQYNFGGELFRPTPEIRVEEGGKLCVVATSWGPRASGKKLSNNIIEFFNTANRDIEVTSPFQKLTCLSSQSNCLRTAVMLANDSSYREDNKNEYLSGLELFVSAKNESELSFVSIGQPHVLLLRNQNLVTLSSSMELSLDLITEPKTKTAPLPQNLLGLHSTSNFEVKSLKLKPKDQIILISRSVLPASLFEKTFSIDEVRLRLAKDNPAMPFWIGELTF